MTKESAFTKKDDLETYIMETLPNLAIKKGKHCKLTLSLNPNGIYIRMHQDWEDDRLRVQGGSKAKSKTK